MRMALTALLTAYFDGYAYSYHYGYGYSYS
jgi:hypothetical protein